MITETNPSQESEKFNFLRLILNFFRLVYICRINTRTFVHTKTSEHRDKKISFICLCALNFSLAKCDYLRHFLLLAPGNVSRVPFHKRHLVLNSISRSLFPLRQMQCDSAALCLAAGMGMVYFFQLPLSLKNSLRASRFLV